MLSEPLLKIEKGNSGAERTKFKVFLFSKSDNGSGIDHIETLVSVSNAEIKGLTARLQDELVLNKAKEFAEVMLETQLREDDPRYR